jgi:hypothetical protein
MVLVDRDRLSFGVVHERVDLQPVIRYAAVRSLALSLALALLAEGAAAQSCSAPIPRGNCPVNTSATLTVPDVMQLTLTSTSTALTAPVAADYDAGFVANTGPSATVKSNRAWRLQIDAGAATWTATNTQPGVIARTNKPAADLRWGTVAGGPFTALSVTPATARSGGATAGTATSFFFQTVYAWGLDTPGAYSLPVVFTLLAP